MKALAVLASRVRFEEKQIFCALERRAVRYTHLDPRLFAAGLRDQAGDVPEFDAALCREISQSRAYYACLLLAGHGVTTVNRAEVIAACGDKARTSLLLAAAGVPTPRTVVALTPDAALEAAEKLGFPVVAKPLTGSWGRLVTLLRDRPEAQTVLEHRAALPSPQQHVIYLQELIDKPGRDIRVLVAGDEVLGATYRYGAEWRTGVARNGTSRPCPLTPELTGLALAAARAVGGGFLGVDMVESPDGLQVLEVNHTPEFRGFCDAHGDAVDVAGAIVSCLLAAA
ncbi:MAG TPA: lysine biosynthesis protein LysX [Streptosporangiaceae bacterium]